MRSGKTLLITIKIMPFPDTKRITLYNAVTPVAVTSSTDATPIVVTATAHGFVTGQRVLIFGHATNIAANGISVVTRLTANTFSLQDEITGANIVGSGAGAGSGGLCVAAPPVPIITGYRNAIFQVGTSGTATLTLKAAGSLGIPGNPQTARRRFPNIGATIAPANPYSFIQLIPLDTQVALAGATGIALSGADVNNEYEANVNALNYLTLIPTSWTQGAITVEMLLTTNL